jgi:hypothetical protein
MAVALPFIMIAGAAISAVGAVRQAQAASAASDYNAKLAEQNAEVATAQGNAAAEAQARDAQRRIGAAVATYGASGVQVDTGSPTDVLADSARNASLDNLTIKYNAKLRALGLQAQAGLDRANAANSEQAGYLNATSQLLSGAAKAGGAFGGGGTGTPATGAGSLSSGTASIANYG